MVHHTGAPVGSDRAEPARPYTGPAMHERELHEPDAAVVAAHDLVKRYGRLTAVDGISFSISRGECLGILGPNGAGKTTTIRMVTCFSPVTSGTLSVAGFDVGERPRDVKRALGFVPQEENLDPDLPVARNLEVHARYFDIDRETARGRAREQLAFFGLEEKAGARVATLSGGMKRRLLIARALVSEPTVLVLDEPTVGLDPQARHLVWQRLRGLRDAGMTMLLTTHYMEEAAQLCDRVLVMHGGHILSEGTPHALIEEHAGAHVLELRAPPQERAALLAGLDGEVDRVEAVDDLVYVFGAGERARELAARTADPGVALLRPGTLEDVFLRLTGRVLSE